MFLLQAWRWRFCILLQTLCISKTVSVSQTKLFTLHDRTFNLQIKHCNLSNTKITLSVLHKRYLFVTGHSSTKNVNPANVTLANQWLEEILKTTTKRSHLYNCMRYEKVIFKKIFLKNNMLFVKAHTESRVSLTAWRFKRLCLFTKETSQGKPPRPVLTAHARFFSANVE